MPEWTFITTHAAVLSLIAKNPCITAIDLSQVAGVTERAVRKAIADLTSTGYIFKSKEGRRVRYQINTKLFLRHPSHREVEIAEFLKALGWKEEEGSVDEPVGGSQPQIQEGQQLEECSN